MYDSNFKVTVWPINFKVFTCDESDAGSRTHMCIFVLLVASRQFLDNASLTLNNYQIVCEPLFFISSVSVL